MSGTGVHGASVASHLADRGARTMIIEKTAPGEWSHREVLELIDEASGPRVELEGNRVPMTIRRT